ncbi:unnamed protein product, partial [Vitis vinifera]
MAAITMDPSLSRQVGKDSHQHGAVVEEIHGLIRVYKDGHVERPQIVPCVTSLLPSDLGVTCGDIVIHKLTNIWAPAWTVSGASEWASEATALKPLVFKGTILIQPFFGGEARTHSEKQMVSPSVLSLTASDTYWRLSLPYGANRDHPWCNPMSKGSIKLLELRLLPTMVCISEMDILRDRNLEFCSALASAGKRVEHVVYKGVGHAFQILNKSPLAQTRTLEMLSHISSFITRWPLDPPTHHDCR